MRNLRGSTEWDLKAPASHPMVVRYAKLSGPPCCRRPELRRYGHAEIDAPAPAAFSARPTVQQQGEGSLASCGKSLRSE